ncbi:hypothetical protein BJF81_03010 [Ornithinimicrobium sp. CNJ-824]|uniref:hypothetical protein n=1 Tax=Ornithinimicrobium sp. CNJ-824 TaxID=1904966 RepID=UPI00095DF4A7|nr:hypothetical protein [Ornithinimicrobium sp. CNJ-824]OLT21494.1 hypothetical protein BJF81_03010 [Ornithinimicrobium sp. CNJ-824]
MTTRPGDPPAGPVPPRPGGRVADLVVPFVVGLAGTVALLALGIATASPTGRSTWPSSSWAPARSRSCTAAPG